MTLIPSKRTKYLAAIIAAASSALASHASAQMFSYTVSPSYAQGTAANTAFNPALSTLNSNADWVYYEYGGQTVLPSQFGSEFSPLVTFGGVGDSADPYQATTGYQSRTYANFNGQTVTATGVLYQYNTSGTVTFVGVTGNNDSHPVNYPFVTVTPQSNPSALIPTADNYLTSTITLNAANEAFTFYATANDGAADFTFTLKNSAGTTLATSTQTGVANTNGGGGNYFGTLTLSLTGAAAGDTLTYKESIGEFTNGNYNQVGIVAITENVPEPSTYALMGLSLVGLLVARNFRRSAA